MFVDSDCESDMELLSPHPQELLSPQPQDQAVQMRTRSLSWLNLSSRSEMGERGRRWSVVSLASSGYTTGATDSPASLSVSLEKERERLRERERERERERLVLSHVVVEVDKLPHTHTHTHTHIAMAGTHPCFA